MRYVYLNGQQKKSLYIKLGRTFAQNKKNKKKEEMSMIVLLGLCRSELLR
jgi:hypothetical protein